MDDERHRGTPDLDDCGGALDCRADREGPMTDAPKPSRLELRFVVEYIPAHHDQYRAEYPEFAQETPPEILAREATACWQWQGLAADVLWTHTELRRDE